MTTRNLNNTWRDVVFAQYAADLEADVPFPLRYLIHAREWNKDILIEIPNRIPIETFRRSIFDFFHAKCRKPEPDYQDKNLSVRARIFLPALMMLGTTARAWRFVIYADSEGETAPTAEYSGDTSQDCTSNPTSHRSFEIHDMGDCWLALYASEADCNDRIIQQEYTAIDEGTTIPPQFTWDWYEIWGC